MFFGGPFRGVRGALVSNDNVRKMEFGGRFGGRGQFRL